MAFGKAAVEIKERAMLEAPGVALAVGFAAFEVAFQQRGTEEVRRRFEGAQEVSLALAQGQRGGALQEAWPTHIYE